MGPRAHRLQLTATCLSPAGGESFYFKVNGQAVFIKGANVIPFHILPTRVTRAGMLRVLEAVRDSNMNMIRIWWAGEGRGGDLGLDLFLEGRRRQGIWIWISWAREGRGGGDRGQGGRGERRV